MFRDGSLARVDGGRYQPLTAQPAGQAALDPNIDTDALGFLAVAVSLLGMGVDRGLWRLTAGDVHRPDNGVCAVESAHDATESAHDAGKGVSDVSASRVFFVRDSGVLSRLEGSGYVNTADPSVVTVHAKEIPERQIRSPRCRYGRTGGQSAREVAIESLVYASTDADGLLSSFKRSTYL